MNNEMMAEIMAKFKAELDARDSELERQAAEEQVKLDKWFQKMEDMRVENEAKAERHATAALERGERMVDLLEQIARDSAAIRTMLSIVYFAKSDEEMSEQ